MSGVQQIQPAQFKQEVLESKLPVVLDFFAPWCGPCRTLGPILENLAKDYQGRIRILKVDIDDAPELAASYKIRGVPTLVLLKEGKVQETMVGLQPAALLKSKIDGLAVALS